MTGMARSRPARRRFDRPLPPFFHALKIYGEALGRGWPVYAKKGDDGITPVLPALVLPDGTDPIRRQSVLGLGLSFRPQARIDLGASVQMGLGGLAPSAVLVRVLVLSAGKTYQGRAATPVAQLCSRCRRGDGEVHPRIHPELAR